MIYWFRTLYIIFMSIVFSDYYEKNALPFDQDHEYEVRVLPYDIDFNLHLNNAQYLSFMEHARFDMILKHGNVFNKCRKLGYGWVVAGVSFQFRRSAKCFEKLRIVTKIICADERWIYGEQNFYVGKKFLGRGIVRMCTVDSKGKAVSTRQYFADVLGLDIEKQDSKFRMSNEDYKKFMSSNTASELQGLDEIMPRVSSFVFHDETLKEK